MQLTLLGTGCPKVDPKRFGPANLISTSLGKILIDCGSGVTQRLTEINISSAEIDALFLTHLHSDHVIDLYQLIISSWHLYRDKTWKVYGPKGVGALFIRKGIDLNPILDGGGQELNLRPGTENIAGIAGLGLSIKKACQNIEKNIEYIKKLENRFIEQLNKYKIDYILHIKDRLPGVLAIGFPGINGQSLLIALDLKGIAISFGSACSSGTTKASKILLDVGINEDLAKSTLRISFGKIHTNKDIDYVSKELAAIINRIKK